MLIAQGDGYSSVADNRRLVNAAASSDKRLVVYPEDWHGWDLLYHAPYKARVNAPSSTSCASTRSRMRP